MCIPLPINEFFPIVPFRASLLFHSDSSEHVKCAYCKCILTPHWIAHRGVGPQGVHCPLTAESTSALSCPLRRLTPQCPASTWSFFLLNFVYSTQQCDAHRGVWFHIICLPQSLPPLFSSHCWVQLHTVSWPLFSREITLLYSGNCPTSEPDSFLVHLAGLVCVLLTSSTFG